MSLLWRYICDTLQAALKEAQVQKATESEAMQTEMQKYRQGKNTSNFLFKYKKKLFLCQKILNW